MVIRYAHISGAQRDALRAEAVQKYRSGMSIREVSIALGRSYGFCHRLLLEDPDLVLRGRGMLGRKQQRALVAGAPISDSPPALRDLAPELELELGEPETAPAIAEPDAVDELVELVVELTPVPVPTPAAVENAAAVTADSDDDFWGSVPAPTF